MARIWAESVFSLHWESLTKVSHLGAWGSVGFESTDTKELDLTLGYSIGGFSVSVTDYWFNTQVATGVDDDGETIYATNKYFKYGAHSTAHVFEAQVGYDFGLLAINWYTNFAGADGVKENGKRAYSSYLALSAPFRLGGLDWAVDLGMVPWETTFYNGYTSGFSVSDVSLRASKDIKITDSFSVPAFAKVSVNPRTEGAYFTFGLSFKREFRISKECIGARWLEFRFYRFVVW